MVGDGPVTEVTPGEQAPQTDDPEVSQRDEGTISGWQLRATLAPNPAMSEVQVQFDLEVAGTVSLQLFDQTGRLAQVTQFAAPAGLTAYTMDLGGMPDGLYLMQLRANGQKDVQKLVILRF